MRKSIFSTVRGRCTILILCISVISLMGTAQAAPWSDVNIRLLPDESFAIVEVHKSDRIRHSPHHDVNGVLDMEQLIYVMGTFDREKWFNSAEKEIAKKHLDVHYQPFIRSLKKKTLEGTININEATLTELIALPHIGPILAVKIVERRTKVGDYQSIDDVKKIEGIGQGIYNAIKHYLRVER